MKNKNLFIFLCLNDDEDRDTNADPEMTLKMCHKFYKFYKFFLKLLKSKKLLFQFSLLHISLANLG